ncbi:MAG: hypothetical protein QW304_06305 [Thermoproteota archaeon]
MKKEVSVITVLGAIIIFILFLILLKSMPKLGTQTTPEPIVVGSRIFPFHLPWDDYSKTVVSLSERLEKPAGNLGYVTVGSDSHLYVDGKRIKFLGVNIGGGACFPEKDEAEKIAARLAKFGVNAVRFHGLDANWEYNIFEVGGVSQTVAEAYHGSGSLKLYFNRSLGDTGGVQVILDTPMDLSNKKLSVWMKVPEEAATINIQAKIFIMDDKWNWGDAGPDITSFSSKGDQWVQLSWDLSVNPPSQIGFPKCDPTRVKAVGVIVGEWTGREWSGNFYIDAFGWSDPNSQAFTPIFDFEKDSQGWTSWGALKPLLGTRLLSEEALDKLDYFIYQLKENGIYVDLNLLVARRFTPEDGLPREIESIEWKDHQALGFFMEEIENLEKEYAEQLLTHFNPYTGMTYAEDPAIAFVEIVNEQGLINSWLMGVLDKLPEVFKSRLRDKWNNYLLLKYGSTNFLRSTWGSLREGESLEQGTVEIVSFEDWVNRRRTYADSDWLEFLYYLEEEFFLNMRNFIKEELRSKALVIGTISSSCSPPSIMSEMDIVDTHAYWQHPQFPGTSWDPLNWYVENKPMVNNPRDSTIVGLAVKNVLNKPHFVTEYGHPAPNMYDAEAVLTIATYAALQDWDGVFMFAYGSRGNWNSSKIRGFFDMDQHPIHMAMLIPAHLIFVRGDVKPANKLVVAKLTREDEMNLLNRQVWAWGLPDAKHVGLNPLLSLLHRTEIDVWGTEFSNFSDIRVSGSTYRSDNEEVTWDTSNAGRGVITVNTPKSIGIIGFGGGRLFDFGTIIVEPGDSLLDGWSVIAFSSLDGENLEHCEKALLVAAGYVTNTGMALRDYNGSRELLKWEANELTEIEIFNGRITCGRDWGSAPTLVEGVPATIKIKTEAGMKVWGLDNLGNRVMEVPVSSEGSYKSFTIGSEFRTIWYEIVFER